MNNMSFGVSMSNDFKVDVTTTNNRGATPEEVAHRCTNKIVGISENAHPAIRLSKVIELRYIMQLKTQAILSWLSI